MKIGVFGSAVENNPEIVAKAKLIGALIAQKGHTLVTGACLGMPHAAQQGATEHKGKCIGHSPFCSLEEHIKAGQPVEGYEKIFYIDKNWLYATNLEACKKYRNLLSVASVDVAIFINGRTGTMNEFTNAFDLGKDIGILEGSGGITTRAIPFLIKDGFKEHLGKLIFEKEPGRLLERLLLP